VAAGPPSRFVPRRAGRSRARDSNLLQPQPGRLPHQRTRAAPRA